MTAGFTTERQDPDLQRVSDALVRAGQRARELARQTGTGIAVQIDGELRILKAKVASGRYTSASEVVREALRLMEQQDQLRLLQFEQLRRDIQDGLASGEAEAWNPKAIKAEGRRRLGAQADSSLNE